jgi:hypothetical protein
LYWTENKSSKHCAQRDKGDIFRIRAISSSVEEEEEEEEEEGSKRKT